MISDETWPYGLLDLDWHNFPKEAEKKCMVLKQLCNELTMRHMVF